MTNSIAASNPKMCENNTGYPFRAHCPGPLYQSSGRTGGSLQMNRFSLRNKQVKFIETSGELQILVEESVEYALNE